MFQSASAFVFEGHKNCPNIASNSLLLCGGGGLWRQIFSLSMMDLIVVGDWFLGKNTMELQ